MTRDIIKYMLAVITAEDTYILTSTNVNKLHDISQIVSSNPEVVRTFIGKMDEEVDVDSFSAEEAADFISS
jgi:hypothetical protein